MDKVKPLYCQYNSILSGQYSVIPSCGYVSKGKIIKGYSLWIWSIVVMLSILIYLSTITGMTFGKM